jgi:hypothetical protein
MKFEITHNAPCPIESHVVIARTPRHRALELLESAAQDPDLANRYMRMFYLLQGTQQEDFSLEMQHKALMHRLHYRLQTHAHEPALKLLALCAPGDMRENLPIDYLVEHQAVRLELLYVSPDQTDPIQIP